MLSGLYEFPWKDEGKMFEKDSLCITDSGRQVTHNFSHFKLTLQIYNIQTEKNLTDGLFVPETSLKDYPISTLMKKVWQKYKANKKNIHTKI